MKKKILSLQNLSKKIQKIKKNKKKIVLCHGVFDLIHIGHIKHFNEAKQFGDYLVVTITPDKFINKGFNRPAFTTSLRLEALSSLSIVDFVAVNDWKDAEETIKYLKPSVYCKGPDYKNSKEDLTGKIINEKKAIESVGGKIKFTSDITYSSSNLINNFIFSFSHEQNKFLNHIKKKLGKLNIAEYLEKIQKPNVLLIGESIIDQYSFCEALGKSGKEPMLVLKNIKTEKYAGGAIAIANHLSDFCKKIYFVSMIGQDSKYREFIKDSLPSNVKSYFIKKNKSPTIIKQRFLETHNNKKMLGIYDLNDKPLDSSNENQFHKYLNMNFKKSDIIITSDYGHGLISKQSAKLITKNKKFKSVNAQLNSSNLGHHTVSKYSNIDALIINEAELRFELRDKNTKLETLILDLVKKITSRYYIITKGITGVTLYDSKFKKFYYCPAFATKVIDKVGAGDAMLSVLSILLKSFVDPDIALFISSIAAAESVESIGNSVYVKKNLIIKKALHILK